MEAFWTTTAHLTTLIPDSAGFKIGNSQTCESRGGESMGRGQPSVYVLGDQQRFHWDPCSGFAVGAKGTSWGAGAQEGGTFLDMPELLS